jgi:hypothetical protein
MGQFTVGLEKTFRLYTKLSMIGWLGLMLVPRWSIMRDWFAPVIAPLMIGYVYIWLVTSNFSLAPDGAGFVLFWVVKLSYRAARSPAVGEV